MINRNICILFISALILIITSCSNQDIYYNDSNTDLDIIGDNTQKAKFANGDTIGVYLVDYLNGNPDKIGSVNNFMNEVFIFDGNYWRNSGPELTLTDPYTVADAYAYSPYDKEMNRTWDKVNLAIYPFMVQEDQESSLKESDFLWAKYDNISTTNTVIKFSFKRLLSKIIINISSNGENIDIDSFSIKNLIANCTINMNNGKVTAKEKIVSIKPYKEVEVKNNFDNIVSAIVVPQTIKKDTPLFYVNIDNKTYAYILDQDINLEQGNAYEFNMNIDIQNSRSIDSEDKIVYKTIQVNKIYNY